MDKFSGLALTVVQRCNISVDCCSLCFACQQSHISTSADTLMVTTDVSTITAKPEIYKLHSLHNDAIFVVKAIWMDAAA